MAKFRLADGRVVMRSTKARTRREALRIAWSWEDASLKARRAELTQAASTKILAELLEFSTGEQLQAPCIQSVVTDYLRSRDTLGRAESTARRYKPIVEGFLASLQEGRARAAVTSLTAQEIERWRDLEVKAGKAAKTVNVGLGVIRAALNACRRKGLILHNPAEAVEPVAGQADERVPFTDDEVRSLLRAAKGADWEGAVLVGVWTGLRLADVASLRWEAVDLDQSLMLVTPMKTGRPLAVAMAPELRDYMTKRKQAAEGRDVFPKLAGRRTGSNGAMAGLSNEFMRLMTKAGISLAYGREKVGKGRRSSGKGFHSLRHSFVSRCASGGAGDAVTKSMTGHTTDSIFRRYVHLGVGDQLHALMRLPSVVG